MPVPTTYFVGSMDYVKPEPRHKLCARFDTVTLQQRGKDNFSVRYGMQVKAGLDYAAACSELGAALMHQLACSDKLDNRERGER